MGPRGRTDAYGQEIITDAELRGERDREWIREKCASGQVFERSKPMTIPELHAAIRERVPAGVTTCVSLSLWHHSHIPRDPIAVNVRVSVHFGHQQCEQATGATCDEAFEKFVANLLPLVNGVEPAPAAERLAEMGV